MGFPPRHGHPLCSALVNYKLHPQNLRLEHEVGRTPDNFVLRGSRFDSYVNSAVVHHQLWAYQAGPDDGVGNVPGVKEGDPFVICIPLWQLLLSGADILLDKTAPTVYNVRPPNRCSGSPCIGFLFRFS